MEISPTVWWILGLLFVYIFGLYEGRGQGYKRRKKEEEEEQKKNSPTPIQPAPSKVETVTLDDPGIMRIKNENGAFTLDLDGARVDTSALTADQRKRLIELLTLIRPWLEGKPAAAPATIAPPPPSPITSGSVFPTVSPPSTPLPAKQTSSSFKIIAPEDRPVPPANSIIGQIDLILQARIAGTSLNERGVFLATSADGGVIVYIGMDKYAGVDAVPDEEVKAAIRAAIAEWEKKYTPGLNK